MKVGALSPDGLSRTGIGHNQKDKSCNQPVITQDLCEGEKILFWYVKPHMNKADKTRGVQILR